MEFLDTTNGEQVDFNASGLPRDGAPLIETGPADLRKRTGNFIAGIRFVAGMVMLPFDLMRDATQ